MQIETARLEDVAKMEKIINHAYRGEEARKGWTHEADLIEGNQRTNANELSKLIQQPGVTFLKCIYESQLAGCVMLEEQGEDIYLGMLSVKPDLQDKGIGKALLQASEKWAKEKGCGFIEMTVISVRKELIEWYQRNGYKDTGDREAFPDNEHFGKPKQPLEFVVLKKSLQS